MISKIRKNCFSFTGRIPQKPFIIAVIIIFIIQFVSGFIIGSSQNNSLLISISWLIIGLSIISQLSFTTRRLHDLNKSGWVLCGMIIIMSVFSVAADYYSQLAGTTYLDLIRKSNVSVTIAKQAAGKFMSISETIELARNIISIVFFLYLSIKKGNTGENNEAIK